MREGRAGVIGLQLTTAPKQVRETRVMRRLIKPSIGRPAVPHEDAREVGPENRRGLVEAPTRLNGVDGGARRRIHPQPLQLSPNPPAGFVGHDHRTLPDRLDQRRIGRRGLPRGAMERLDQPPGRDRQPEGLLKDGGHLADGQAELLMPDGSSRHRARPQLRGRRAERIGGLERMPARHAPPTPLTLPDVDVKRAHQRRHRRQVFLVWRRHGRFDHRARTARTDGRERGVVRFVDVRRDGPVGGPAIGETGFPIRASRVRTGAILGKRRRLPKAGAPRRLECRAKAVVLASQSLVVSPQRIALTLGAFRALAPCGDVVALRGGLGRPVIRHIDVMPDPRPEYTSGMFGRLFNEAAGEARTR